MVLIVGKIMQWVEQLCLHQEQQVPQTPKVASLVERAKAMFVPDDNFAVQLDALLPLVKADEEARKRFLEILDTMGPGDPRTATYRRKMTGMLFA